MKVFAVYQHEPVVNPYITTCVLLDEQSHQLSYGISIRTMADRFHRKLGNLIARRRAIHALVTKKSRSIPIPRFIPEDIRACLIYVHSSGMEAETMTTLYKPLDQTEFEVDPRELHPSKAFEVFV